TLDYHWIDDSAAVVHDEITNDRHLAGLDVDLDLGNVRAIGIGRLLGREVARRFEPRRRPTRHGGPPHADPDPRTPAEAAPDIRTPDPGLAILHDHLPPR